MGGGHWPAIGLHWADTKAAARMGASANTSTPRRKLPPSTAPPSSRRSEFWLTSNRFLARLYASPLVTIAAIRGAPVICRGGCCR